MSMKVTLGVNKKIGQPNYGSRGASCHVEFELEGAMDANGFSRFQQAARQVYDACRAAVDGELDLVDRSNVLPLPNATDLHGDGLGGLVSIYPGPDEMPDSQTRQVTKNDDSRFGHLSGDDLQFGEPDGSVDGATPADSSGSAHQNLEVPLARRVTEKQVRALFALAKKNGANLYALLRVRYRLTDPHQLDRTTASHLIDQLASTLSQA